VINNHLTFKIKYNVDSQGTIGIVGAAVIPSSIEHTYDSCVEGKEIPRNLGKLRLTDGLTSIPWSYSVEWEPSTISWSFRWDSYLNTGDREEYKIHWFSIVNSLLIVLFLTVKLSVLFN
jgi:transmembrane 9 superfamily protein 2/4